MLKIIINDGRYGPSPTSTSMYEVQYLSEKNGIQFRMNLREFILLIIPESRKKDIDQVSYELVKTIHSYNSSNELKRLEDSLEREYVESQYKNSMNHRYITPHPSIDPYSHIDTYKMHYDEAYRKQVKMEEISRNPNTMSGNSSSLSTSKEVLKQVIKDSDVYYLMTS